MFLLLLLLCCKSFPYARIFATPPLPPFSSLLCHGTPAFTLHPRSVRPKDRSRLQHGAPSSCHASNLSAKMPNSSIDKQLPCVPLQAFSTPSFQTRAQIATNMCLSSACLLLFTLWPCHLKSRRNTPAAVKFVFLFVLQGGTEGP